ncbi:MAG: Lsr2 dimerization domain-containing protein [Pseudonocardiaceae bacterium]
MTKDELVDDLGGSAAVQTVAFGLDGRSIEIDLAGTHSEQLRSALSPFPSLWLPCAMSDPDRAKGGTTMAP